MCEVQYYVPSNPGVSPGTAIASAMASAFGLSPGGQGPEYAAYQAVSTMFTSGWFLTAHDWEDENAPKAFLNYILFDEDFIPYDMGWDQISTDAEVSQSNSNPPHERLSLQAVVEKPGYVYIYYSNEETADIVEVYWDDFTVKHKHGPVVQGDEYYPFGLTYNSFQRESSLKNRWKFQGQEHIDDLNLGWDSFKWRNHQPDIGRFFNVDPLAEKYYFNSTYAFSENKVVAHVELEGLESLHFTVRSASTGGLPKRKFSSSDYYNNNSAAIVTVDLAKKQITDSKCGTNCDTMNGLSITENKDGSISLSATMDFESDGLVTFNITIQNNIDEDGTFNVKSTVVTDNKSPFEVIMSGTEDGEKERGGILLNTVSATAAPIPRGLRSRPATAEDQAEMDVMVYKSENPDDARLGYVKNKGDKEFKNPVESNQEKARKPTVILP